jgi:Mn2+/Fe2+ NRAMP family transporter
VALEPLAGGAASTLFAVGLIGAAILAASILPCPPPTRCANTQAWKQPSMIPSRTRRRVTFGSVTLAGVLAVLLPNVPLVTILVATQVLNAVLLVPILVAMIGIARDRDLMGRFTIGLPSTAAYSITTAVVVLCVAALAVASLAG